MTAPVMIMAGGTGGHVVPALTVAQVLTDRGVPVVWLGTRAGIEARLVPAAGIPIRWLDVAGLRGKGLLRKLFAPLMLIRSVLQAVAIIRAEHPRAVLGMGGFASGPGGLAARLLGIRLVVHEQNAIAGMTNRWLARLTSNVAVAFDGALPNAQRIANPVRKDIAEIAPPGARFQARVGPIRLLVLGGSQGASALNETLPASLAKLNQVVEVRHQCGRGRSESTELAYEQYGVAAEVLEFVDDMAGLYGWADIAVCRAGALTVAEISAAGLAAVFVPFPQAVDDHQTLNAQALVDADAAIMIQQSGLTPDRLAETLETLIADRALLLDMAESARTFADVNAGEKLADLCLGAEAATRAGAES